MSLRKKKEGFFVPFILSEENFFNIFVLSRCIVYLISLQNINTFTYQKTLLHTSFCFSKKSPKAFRAFFRKYMIQKTIEHYRKISIENNTKPMNARVGRGNPFQISGDKYGVPLSQRLRKQSFSISVYCIFLNV